MPVLPVRLFGDPVLTIPADQVTTFDAELRRLVRNLDETLYDQRGSGLAAPQVGVGLRVFVFHDDDMAGHLVNPVLDFPDEQEQDGPEGCLSMPGLYFDTKRRLNVVARGWSAAGDRSRSSAPATWPAACSTRPTISTASCSSTAWTAPAARPPCARSALPTGTSRLPR